MIRSESNVRFTLIFSNSKTPNRNSTVTTIIAIGNASFSRKGILNTEGEKYSSSLKENPTGSTAFTKARYNKYNGYKNSDKSFHLI